MATTQKQTHRLQSLHTLKTVTAPSVADQVFDVLQQRILSLKLSPNTKISEVEVAKMLGVSRQPVRESFKRLAKLGFLDIRPQSRTTISLISEDAVLRARFIRSALEVKTIQAASLQLDEPDHTALSGIIDEQRAAIGAEDVDKFHSLDEAFHMQICDRAGLGFVWDVILDCKAHMDRVRRLSLDEGAQHVTLNEHIEILNALKRRDTELAADAMTRHLDRILVLINSLKAQNHDWFTTSQ